MFLSQRVLSLMHQRPAPVVPEQVDLEVATQGDLTVAPRHVDLPPLPEAPASVNCHITIAGRQVQLTLRDSDEARLLERLAVVLAQFPVPQPTPQASSQPQGQGQLSPPQHNALAMHHKVTGVCPVHNVAMKQTTKDGRSWWSHRLPDGQWCKGR